MTPPRTEDRWAAHPVLGRLLRWVLFAIPLLISTGTVVALRPLVPGGLGWAVLLGLLAVVVAVAFERVLRRFLPLAALLRLTMLFPDEAPSRFKVARAAGNPTELRRRLAHDADAVSTAEQVLALITALGEHDRRTRGHSERVRVFCDLLAEQLHLEQAERDRLRWASLLHDVGKLSIAATILNKPAKLDEREFNLIKGHPERGAALTAPLLPWLGEWGLGIVEHHEHYDGGGYPRGLTETDISRAGRIIGIVDAFETMTAARAYKKAMATKAAREELARCAGKQFDPTYVRAFLAISLPRLVWTMGPLSFLLQLPFLSTVAQAGSRSAAVSGQAATAVAGVGAAATVGVAGMAGWMPEQDVQRPMEAAASSARPAERAAQQPMMQPPLLQRAAAGVQAAPLGRMPELEQPASPAVGPVSLAASFPPPQPSPQLPPPTSPGTEGPLASVPTEAPVGPPLVIPSTPAPAAPPVPPPVPTEPAVPPPGSPSPPPPPAATPPTAPPPAPTPTVPQPLPAQTPVVRLLDPPSGIVTTSQVSLAFDSDMAGVTYECSVDGGLWTPCTSPFTRVYEDGPHTVDVRAFGAVAGPGEPARASFDVDAAGPEVRITQAPSSTVTTADVQIGFTSPDPAASFECALDSGPWTPCTSPTTFAELSDGTHAVEVRAVSAAGRTGAPRRADFTVDVPGPEVTITGAPPEVITSRDTEVAFTSPSASATFECSLDGDPWAACTSPTQLPAMSNGRHTFAVRAVDAVRGFGVEQATTFTVKPSPAVKTPTAEILSAPSGTTTSSTVELTFTSDDRDATYECRVDAGAWLPCSSPAVFVLADGTHTLSVRATSSSAGTGAAVTTAPFHVAAPAVVDP